MSNDEHIAAAPEPGADTASPWPSMRYGELERLLIEVSGGDRRSVLGRFRNLRQVPFPDAIKTGTGNQVEYDLPRLLAFCAVYEVNALLVPQSHAVALVRDSWPELVRGFIAGAVTLGIADRPADMPKDMSALVSIHPNGFASDDLCASTAANIPSTTRPNGGATALRIDCKATMEVVASRLDRSGVLDGSYAAFGDLDRSFGWSRGSVPHRATVAEMAGGSSFLDRGPYLERAAAFLRIATTLPSKDLGDPSHRRSVQAAQDLLDYLTRPVPIDEWKGEIGTEEGRPRLKHILAAVGDAAGLSVPVLWPETLLATAAGSPTDEAAALIDRAARAERAKGAGRMPTIPT